MREILKFSVLADIANMKGLRQHFNMWEVEMQTDKGELTILLKGTGMQETLVKLGNGFLFLQRDF